MEFIPFGWHIIQFLCLRSKWPKLLCYQSLTKLTSKQTKSKISQMLNFISFHVKITFSNHCSKVWLGLTAVNSNFNRKRSHRLIRIVSGSCCRQYNSFQFDNLQAQIGFKMSKISPRKKKFMILSSNQGPIMVQFTLVSAGSNPDVDNFQHFFLKSLHKKFN